ncbi:MAG: sigma 54-interacting transcriptional regulator [Clostridia bacterium]|nr:sigma 54-interacting transcriptional regulator [Clostridia bacterium]
MVIKDGFRDITIVNDEGKIEYFSIGEYDFFKMRPGEMLGTKVTDWYKNLDEENSTLMIAVNTGEEILDIVQDLTTINGRDVRQRSNTLCIRKEGKIIGAIEFIYYDEEADVLIDRFESADESANRREKRLSLDNIVGECPEMLKLKQKTQKIFKFDSPVFITGQTGTGKELLARVIHNSGKRSKGPFIYVNCGAIPENLMEGILFGIRKGSFTDAEEKEGLFKMADEGTIFLDEINAMPLLVQGKLLRALEEKRIRPLGANEEERTNCRIIASCNQPVRELLKSKELREDLFFRLSVIMFDLPPLCMREGDVKTLTGYYIDYFNEIFGKNIKGLSKEAESFFEKHDWPGNVRELRNCLEGAFNIAEGERIELSDIGECFKKAAAEDDAGGAALAYKKFKESGADLKTYLKKWEDEKAKEVFEKLQNEAAAAEYLGISKQKLRYRLGRE